MGTRPFRGLFGQVWQKIDRLQDEPRRWVLGPSLTENPSQLAGHFVYVEEKPTDGGVYELIDGQLRMQSFCAGVAPAL